jgi:hypothetical protein
MARVLPETATPLFFSPDRSTMSVGCARRCFKVGINVWPPDMTMADAEVSSSRTASAMLAGR